MRTRRSTLPSEFQSTIAPAGAIVLAAALAGCGGGGSSSAISSAPSAVTFSATCLDGSVRTSTISAADAQSQCPSPASGPLVTSIPAPTYLAGSQQLQAFQLLNAERQACGFGLVAQNTRLDQAAQGQAQYTVTNDVVSHFQTPGAPAFTGATLGDRIVAAAYPSSPIVPGAEIIAFEATGRASMRALLSTPYHGLAAVGPYLEVGLGSASDLSGTVQSALAAVLGVPSGASRQGSVTGTAVLTYPCEGSTEVRRTFPGEFPNPLGTRNYTTNPAGPTIMVLAATGTSLLLSSATVTNAATGAVVQLAMLRTAGADTNGLLGWNSGFVIPDQPLDANTRYQVTVSGTVYPNVQGSGTVSGDVGGACSGSNPGMTKAGVGLLCSGGTWTEAPKTAWTRTFSFMTGSN